MDFLRNLLPNEMELAAIWLPPRFKYLTQPLNKDGEVDYRIAEGSLIAVNEQNELCNGLPTHKVLGCFARHVMMMCLDYTIVAKQIDGDDVIVIKLKDL